ncbi:oligoendopeptidase F [candidate division KSB1 bacterium]|nr:oligoendopeptidase F [candidate division KSB1 bacterium]
MKFFLGVVMTLFGMMLFNQNEVYSQTRERAQIPVQDTWNLNDLYPTLEAWNAAKTQLTTEFDKITPFKGKLAKSSADLLACLKLNSDIGREYGRLYSYVSMLSDQDTRDAKAQGMKQEIGQMGTDFSSKSAFIEPEILAMDENQIQKFITAEPGLKEYDFYLNNLIRQKAHKLSEKEEKIMAETSMLSDAPYSIYSIFSNAELPYPEVTLSDGKTVLVNQAGYSRFRAVPNRDDREKVFDAFWGKINTFRQTMGAQLNAAIKRDLFYARARGYNTCLESALDYNNIPVQVYHALIENVNANLSTFHRYLDLRKRMLGVDTLKYSDLYSPVVKGIELEFNTDQARAEILEALKPLGKDYVGVLEQAFQNRWIDMYPTTGKRSGAYSNGSVYDVHPYILMNYNGQYDDVSTLAHELGHSLHSYCANKTQAFPKADYPIFVAEVASTFNEALLIDSQLKKIKDDDVRLSLLMSHLDGIKGTVFRQTQFAEFELRMHEMAEKNQPLTGDALTELYSEIVRKYYGHEKGVCLIPDLYTVEWAYIPHFYYNFYVYQYATSFTASIAMSEKVLSKEKGAAEKFLAFLSAGGSDYPINLLKKAGVDMTTAEPFNKTMKVMNQTMDEIEKILKKKGK